ncbi:Smr/MutS family protein [Alysiella filiformis]|uniref:DNA-nicking endonuclease, Smr domain n=1 Tax=Alysiella filiformis DSM 16848 TaxID=1120981 RepID=A0A286EFM4_9NEIS|nr:Smr/MutS family protein [Alysiella filiformis]QMT30664.1 Smr/MutS family protein [Alysiella filiformis]UBQ56358.1 Smr/MutS family protein [Alysiella filiformis DSM 16848]SOD69639.1 DNA-nicking endonuclease, Smr domain [Alysiella filiformis DSM 16848]
MNFQDALKDLGKQAREAAKLREQAEQEAKKIQQEQADVDFAALMKDVTPLKNAHANYVPPRDTSPIKLRPKDTESDKENHFYIGESGVILDIPDTFSKNGQGANDIKRLLNGHYEVVADVDLHGYTQEYAQEVLNEFIEFVQKRGVCGEIVHGSGLGSSGYKPVLKTMVRRWLMQHPDVLAYAQPSKNNDGAVRILVKRQRRIDPFAEEK